MTKSRPSSSWPQRCQRNTSSVTGRKRWCGHSEHFILGFSQIPCTRYLTDTVGSSGLGYFPQLEKVPPHNHGGVGGMHLYVPWWKFDRKNEFQRGYHIEFALPADV